jgi:Putative transposase
VAVSQLGRRAFGSGLQLNIHFHTVVLDGVFNEARPGHLTFHPAPPPSDEDVAQVLATVRTRGGQLLAATGSSRIWATPPPAAPARPSSMASISTPMSGSPQRSRPPRTALSLSGAPHNAEHFNLNAEHFLARRRGAHGTGETTG